MKKPCSAIALGWLQTPRLDILALTIEQLKMLLEDASALQKELDLLIDESVIDKNVIRAIGMKLEKMEELPAEEHLWQTYWLIIIREKKIGAGLAGFKSRPNDAGLTEIGYGISPSFQKKGYMTEAVQVLVDWAFENPHCQGVTASTVINPASNRLLEKLGAEILKEDENSTSWVIKKKPRKA